MTDSTQNSNPQLGYDLAPMQAAYEAVGETGQNLVQDLRNYLHATARDAQASNQPVPPGSVQDLEEILAAGTALRVRSAASAANLLELIDQLRPQLQAYIYEYEEFARESEVFFYNLYESEGGEKSLEYFTTVETEEQVKELTSNYPNLRSSTSELESIFAALQQALVDGNGMGAIEINTETGEVKVIDLDDEIDLSDAHNEGYPPPIGGYNA